MAVSIQDAREKWETKTAQVGQKWKNAVTQAGAARYCEGLGKLGINVAACQAGPGARWANALARVDAAKFQQAIAGKGAKWQERFTQAFQA